MAEKSKQDMLAILLVSLLSFLVFSKFDVLEKIVAVSSRYEKWEIDEIVSTFIVLAVCLAIFAVRRVDELLQSQHQLQKRNEDLQHALSEIKQLKGILPLCSFCKKIRNDEGYWEQVDAYIQKHSDADISHSVCPECAKIHYPEYEATKSQRDL